LVFEVNTIEDYKNNLLESNASHTNRRLQEKPVGIHLPHIPIEDYKNNLLESYTSHTNRGLQEKPVGIHHSCNPLLVCEVEDSNRLFL
jgi:hypothetical protein